MTFGALGDETATMERQFLNRPNPAPLILDKARPVHFIGAGGIGMSALAKILLAEGYTVSGSDASDGAYLQALEKAGGTVYSQHATHHVPNRAVVVASSAIDTQNCEVQAAQAMQLPIFHRSDLLREIMQLYPISIGLTGTHGKTTMTGMTGMVLEAGGLDPTIIAGGKIPQLGTNAKAGHNTNYIVAELDESDGTVTQYQPTYSVISNLELDHPDHYKAGLEAVKATFHDFLRALGPNHTVLFNVSDPVTAEFYHYYAGQVRAIAVYPKDAPHYPADSLTYALRVVEVHQEGGYQGDLYCGDERLGRIWLQVPGHHNLENAMFAAIIGHQLKIPFDTIRTALENFTGMGRRFEKLGLFQGAEIIDDYAHHPTEVQATLRASQEFVQGRGRVIAVFQPHRYQRLQALWDEFLTAFDDADELIVLDVYAAGDAPINGISGPDFTQALIAQGHPAVEYWPILGPAGDWSLAVARLKTILTAGDLLITMGAGDITTLGRQLVASES